MGRKKGRAKTREEKLARRGRLTQEEIAQNIEAKLQETRTKQARLKKELDAQNKIKKDGEKELEEYHAYMAVFYPPGCLHTLMEEERGSPEMDRYLDAIYRFEHFCGSYECSNYFEVFWDYPDNKKLVDKTLVRSILCRAVQLVKQKEQIHANWKEVAYEWLGVAINLIGTIKYGSAGALRAAVDSWKKRGAPRAQAVDEDDEVQVNEEQGRFLFALVDVITSLLDSHLGVIYVLNQFTRCTDCKCMETEWKKEQEKLSQDGNPDACFVCSVCDKRYEQKSRFHKVCGLCQLRCYCSKECQRQDWKHGTEGMKHFHICPIIQEITSLEIVPRADWGEK